MTALKLWLNTVGVVALVLGVIGIFVPLLPTTPFLLLASACFLRGSDRLHSWLLGNPHFGKIIRDFEEKRAVPRRAKVIGLGLMWLSMSVSAAIVPAIWLKLLLLALAIGVTIYLVRLPTIDE